MKQINIISSDKIYARMLASELKRRGYDAVYPSSAAGAMLYVIDLDSVGSSKLSYNEDLPCITFSRNSGADLLRPFEIDLLTSKIAEKNHTLPNPKRIFTDASIFSDRNNSCIYVGTEAIYLTKQEFCLFDVLYTHEGEMIGKSDLEEAVWGESGSDNRLRVYIKYLRDKIEEPLGRRIIFSMRGKGYKMKLN